MIFSLDTNVMIDIVNGRPWVRAWMDRAVEQGGQIVACPLASHELIYGSLISQRRDLQLIKANSLLNDLTIIELSHEDGLKAAEIRRVLRRRGLPIGAYDLMIGAQAMNRGWTVVSHNLRELDRIDGLAVVDWTQPILDE